MNKFLATFCIIAAYLCYADAATKDEAYNLISQVSNEIMARENSALQSAISETLASVTTPLQRSCVNRLIGTAHADLYSALGKELVSLRREFGSYSEPQFQQIDPDTLTEQIGKRLSVALSSFKDTVEQIRQCA